MNSIGAMSSPVKQPLPSVLAPPNISTSSPSKVQQPPNLTPLNLNTTSQPAQPLSLVNENKSAPAVIPSPPVVTSVQNIVSKPTSCNGVPEVKPNGGKVEEAVSKIEPPVSRNQVNNSVKSINESPIPEIKTAGVSEVGNLSQKKEDKSLTVSQTDKVLPETIEAPVIEPIKSEESPQNENVAIKPTENVTQVNQEVPENKAAISTNQGQTASPEKNEQSSSSTAKVAVRRKREHKVSTNLILYAEVN